MREMKKCQTKPVRNDGPFKLLLVLISRKQTLGPVCNVLENGHLQTFLASDNIRFLFMLSIEK